MNRVTALYRRLRRQLGAPAGQWTIWCRRPKKTAQREQVIIESILTQRANWKNVRQAAANLETAGALELAPILKLKAERLAGLIRPSGFYRQKAECLRALASCLIEECGGLSGAGRLETAELRRRLLALKGIGPETADDILLYAFDRPVFVIDEYTRRLVRDLNWTTESNYQRLQELFEAELPPDYQLYQNLHALIVMDGKSARPNRKPAEKRKGKVKCRKKTTRARAG